MDLKELEKIIKLVEKSNINQIKIEEDGIKIEIVKEDEIKYVQAEQQVMYQPITHQVAPPVSAPVSVTVPEVANQNESKIANDEIVITSPMVGTFYSSSSPEEAAYVKIGDRINIGDPVCIIEAMKLFNEIESDCAGTVVKIMCKNEESVEFGQKLFILTKDE